MSATTAVMPPDVSVGPGMADLTIMLPGNRSPIVIEAAEVSPSWELNQQSTLIADCALSDLTANFQPLSILEGMWISWYGAALGVWTGKVASISADPLNGAGQLNCVDHSGNLDKRLIPGKTNLVLTGYAGGLADVLCKYAEMDDTLWLNSVDYEDAGDILSIQPTGQDLLATLRQNAQDADQEFRVDENRNLIWRQRLGRDLRRSVQLNAGVEIASYTPSWDASNVINDLTMVPAKENYAARYARRTVDQDSVDALGRRQERSTTGRAIRPAALRAIGKRRVDRLAAQGRTISLDVVNVNECFASFREGDRIRLVLAGVNLACDARILQRSYTLSDGILLLAAEIES
jgi:hypothetical protein